MLQNANIYVSYNPDDGVFTRKVSTNNRNKVGEQAGYLNKCGYRIVVIEGVRYYAHRLAFHLMGLDVPITVDHIDGNPMNNTWTNLRAVDRSQNSTNRKVSSDNKLGHKNICVSNGRYLVQVMRHGVNRSQRFDTLDAAISFRDATVRELHGDYTRCG